MKVVHISAYDTIGGASIACLRHAEAMRLAGLDVSLVVAYKYGKKPFVVKGETKIESIKNHIHKALLRRLSNSAHFVGTFSLMRFGHSIYRLKVVEEADVIFIHWVNSNALSIDGIEKILKLNKPTYWYMHDMFPITGGCHYSLDCEGYIHDCSDCPLIGNSHYAKVAAKQLKQKLIHWRSYENLSFITPSKWLSDCVGKSQLGKDKEVFTVRNVIDTSLFRPLPINCKEVFGLDSKKRTILVGAASLNSVYKGSKYILSLLHHLHAEQYEALIIGECDNSLVDNVSINVVQTGFLSDDYSLLLAYNACDTFVITSMAENYPNVVLEAMACGKPCVGFNTGGIPDLIVDGISGIIVYTNSSEELVISLNRLFADEKQYYSMSTAAREQIVNNNSYMNVLSIHSELKWPFCDKA